jgi:hypothetical protein
MRNTIYILTTVVVVLIAWLFISVFIAFFGEMDYVTALKHPSQMFFVLFLYWWLPLAIIQDMELFYTNFKKMK